MGERRLFVVMNYTVMQNLQLRSLVEVCLNIILFCVNTRGVRDLIRHLTAGFKSSAGLLKCD